MQSSYISGIAQGANVGKDQVIILGVTSGSSVTVNTQVTMTPAPDSAAACRLSYQCVTPAQLLRPYDISLDVQQAVLGLGLACASHAAVSWADGGRLSIAQHAQMMKALLSL